LAEIGTDDISSIPGADLHEKAATARSMKAVQLRGVELQNQGSAAISEDATALLPAVSGGIKTGTTTISRAIPAGGRPVATGDQ